MEQTPWLDNPVIKDMHPLKVQIMTELARDTAGKPLMQAVPYLLKAQQSLKASDLSFSEEETALLMEVFTNDMTDAEKQQVERMKALISQHMK